MKSGWEPVGTGILKLGTAHLGWAAPTPPHPEVGSKYFMVPHEHFQVLADRGWRVKLKVEGVLLISSEQSQLLLSQSSMAVCRQGCNSSTLKMTRSRQHPVS